MSSAQAERQALLRDLLIETKDGEWGKESACAGHLAMRVVRGTDFPDARFGDLKGVPLRFIPEHIALRKRLRPWDILIETAGGSPSRPTGRTVLLKPSIFDTSDLPLTCASFARFLRANETRVDPAYLFWFLQHLYATGEMERHQVQHTGVARFQYTRFAETVAIPLPARADQRAIASILGALDDKIDLNRRMNETLEELARTIFKSWFVDFDPVRAKAEGRQPVGMDAETMRLFPSELVDSELGEVPAGWDVTTLGRICSRSGGDIQTGPFGSQLHASDYVEQGIPSVMPKDLKEDRISSHDIARIRREDAERLSRYRLREGDIVYSRRGDVERCALVTRREEGWLCGTGCLRVRLGEKGDEPVYVFGAVTTDRARSWVVRHAHGATMPNLNTSILGELPLCCPPPPVQAAYRNIARPLLDRRDHNWEENGSLTSLRDTLLPKLISGELHIASAEKLAGEAL